jgi:hypothetical protein
MTPALAWGAALISIPIIIHLLNRRRFRVVDWAAMEWLLLAIKQNKRRITFEQLLLLALRCLIILLAVFAIARLFFSGSPALAKLAETRTDWILVLDDSFTAGQSGAAGTGTCFDRGKAQVVRLLRSLLQAESKDSFAVLATEGRGRTIPASPQLDREAVDGVARKLEHLDVIDLKHHPLELLQRGIAKAREGQNTTRAIVLVSDCRQKDWAFLQPPRPGSTPDPVREDFVTALKEAQAEDIGVYLLDVGPEDRAAFDNVAVTRLEPGEKTVQTRAVTEFNASIANLGPDEVRDVTVQFTVTNPDGSQQTLDADTIPRIATGRKNAIPVTRSYAFKEPGSYAVTVAIGSDPLTVDNERHLALDVTRGIEVLLVNGEPDPDEPELSETYALARACDPPGNVPTGVHPSVVESGGAGGLTEVHVEKADIIALCNVERLQAPVLEALEKRVRNGGGLVIFPGDRTDVAAFSRQLYKKGAGLAPAALKPPVGDAEGALTGTGEFIEFSSREVDHPLMQHMFAGVSAFFQGTRFYRRFEVELPRNLEAAKVDIAARYHKANVGDQGPAILEKEVGKGRVILFTVPADREWTNWPAERNYPVAMLQMMKYLYVPGARERNLPVGGTYTKRIDLQAYGREVSIEPPRGGKLRREAKPTPDGGLAVTFQQTNTAGIYRLEMTPRAGGKPLVTGSNVEYFAANIDTRPSDLRRPAAEPFESHLGQVGIGYARTAEDVLGQKPEDRVDLWHWLIIGLMACLALESFAGWKFGHHGK